MSLGKFLDPKNGLAFKRIFGSEKKQGYPDPFSQ